MLRFHRRYFLLAILLFIVEVLIALYVRDWLIRPYGGDYLVVILLYCGVRSFLDAAPWKIALAVLLFAYGIETLQYFRIVQRLGLSHNVLARTVIGTGFEWLDLLAYTLGVATVLLLEYRSHRKR
ncbi:ribosomal maturation YjgA family protein [Flaviaesturariibacter terrae]